MSDFCDEFRVEVCATSFEAFELAVKLAMRPHGDAEAFAEVVQPDPARRLIIFWHADPTDLSAQKFECVQSPAEVARFAWGWLRGQKPVNSEDVYADSSDDGGWILKSENAYEIFSVQRVWVSYSK